jgi:peptidyl-tRNA hydrolase, PTH1 family
LIVGLGNPGSRYERTRHNIGFRVAGELADRWDMAGAKDRYKARIAEGRMRPGGPRVVLLTPQTYMNESGDAAGPARGQMRIPLENVIAVHDEIDLPFGEIRSKLGGGVAGHNGLKSLKRGLGSPDFQRVRVGVGRPDSTDPEIVSAYVLGRFSESDDEVAGLISEAADEVERLVDSLAAEANENE